jgi:hypothetical protein
MPRPVSAHASQRCGGTGPLIGQRESSLAVEIRPQIV